MTVGGMGFIPERFLMMMKDQAFRRQGDIYQRKLADVSPLLDAFGLSVR